MKPTTLNSDLASRTRVVEKKDEDPAGKSVIAVQLFGIKTDQITYLQNTPA